MNRHGLREQVFKLLFRVEFTPMEEMPQQEAFFAPYNDQKLSEDDAIWIRERYEKIAEKLPEIDEMIDTRTEGWDVKRMAKVDLTAIRLAVYEILFDEEVPTGVAINEAVELARTFGEDGSPAFVNGVLARFVPEAERIEADLASMQTSTKPIRKPEENKSTIVVAGSKKGKSKKHA